MALDDISARYAPVDLVAFHHASVADPVRAALAGTGSHGLDPIALCAGGAAVSILPGPVVTVVDGVSADATCVVEFVDERAFSDFAHELRTVPGAQVAGQIRYRLGGYAEFDDWEPALRALYAGRAVFDPSTVDRRAIERTFHWSSDDVATIGAFVGEHGFAVVHDVFTAAEVAVLDEALLELERAVRPDVAGTWWTRDAAGRERVCQIHYASRQSSALAELETDARMLALLDACAPGLVAHADRMNGHFAVLKRPGASGGLTDLPWHIDCGLGGHSLMCPGLHLGVQLTASNPEVGAFSVLAGSHERSVRRSAVDAATWPVVTVQTQPGDVTIHVPHAMHAAPPPAGQGEGRRTLYLGFGTAEAHEVIGAGRSFDDLLSAAHADGHVEFDAR